MFETHSGAVLIRVISVLALTLLAGCCSTHSRAGNVDEIPLLVQFDKLTGCPKVIQVVDSCEPHINLPQDVQPYAKDGSLVCRKKGKKITWLSVRGESTPYSHWEPAEFRIELKQAKDEKDKPVETPTRGDCKKSKNGVLECKIKADAESGVYEYDVIAAAGCSIDPRFYVPQA